MKIAGIDLSMNGTGICLYDSDRDIEYKKRISKDIFNIDKNQSAQVNTQSTTQRQMRLSR